MAVMDFLRPLRRKSWSVDELYHTYRNQMYALAFSILRSQMEAEDAVHDVFVRVAANQAVLEKIKTDEDMRNYLLKATKNTARWSRRSGHWTAGIRMFCIVISYWK